MPSVNIMMLQTVANGLGELKENIVFVGGAVAELYASDPAASDIRPTLDVDCVIELNSRIEHSRLEEKLRAKGFAHDTSIGAPICRKIYKGIKVDVMPADSAVLGFSNQWYHDGIENRMAKVLPSGIEIFVFTPEYYLASKFAAHRSRGGNDLRQSHDFEDIIYILDNCLEILTSIRNANLIVKAYLKKECQNLLKNEGLTEGVESALPFDSDSDRTGFIEDLIQNIAEIE
ncbi:MAG: nucleotidyl transferase AbiEii/AbiGii toxin family protein [Bacteroidales bacterium]|nr:nucleotidyl transferase AbiEii/AbiGii toxin family protein [Bacteroidales bacterium]